jgi:hypothetical protein
MLAARSRAQTVRLPLPSDDRDSFRRRVVGQRYRAAAFAGSFVVLQGERYTPETFNVKALADEVDLALVEAGLSGGMGDRLVPAPERGMQCHGQPVPGAAVAANRLYLAATSRKRPFSATTRLPFAASACSAAKGMHSPSLANASHCGFPTTRPRRSRAGAGADRDEGLT